MNTSSAKAEPDVRLHVSRLSGLIDQCEQLLNEAEHRAAESKATKERTRVNETASPEATPSEAKHRTRNRAANHAALQLLMDAYPQTFSRDAVKPLKIGIQEDLIADDRISRNKIKRALASYVRAPQYLRCLVEDAPRIGLDGQPAGTVSAEEAEHARERLKEFHQQRRQRQREQEKQAREQEKQQRLNTKLDQLLQLNQR